MGRPSLAAARCTYTMTPESLEDLDYLLSLYPKLKKSEVIREALARWVEDEATKVILEVMDA